MTIEGSRKKRTGQAKSRRWLLIVGFIGVYCVIGGRLVEYASAILEWYRASCRRIGLMEMRPDIPGPQRRSDGNDIRTVSLFAEPNKVVDADEAVESSPPFCPTST